MAEYRGFQNEELYFFKCAGMDNFQVRVFCPENGKSMTENRLFTMFCRDYFNNFYNVCCMINEQTQTDGIDPVEECKKNLQEWFTIEEFLQCAEDFFKGKCVYCGGMNSIIFLYEDAKYKMKLFLSSEGKKSIERGDYRPLEALAFYSSKSKYEENITILHAAAILQKEKNRVFLFTGISGSGKSTICNKFKGSEDILSDELAILRINRNSLETCGSPWSTDEEFTTYNSTWYPVEKIFFLNKNMPYAIRKQDSAETLVNLINQLYPYAYLHISSFNHLRFDCKIAKTIRDMGMCYQLDSMLDSDLSLLFQ